MDIIRSAYRTNVSFFKDDPTELTEITWYFVPDTAPILPFTTPFSSRVWDIREGIVPELGERAEPRFWSAGHPPWGDRPGKPCGTAKQWLEGCSISETPPLEWPGTRVPMCCPRPNVVITPGGEAYTAAIATGITTECAPTVAIPRALVFRVTGTGVTCACWAGLVATLTWSDANQRWESATLNPCGDPPPPATVSLTCVGTAPFSAWTLRIGAPGFVWFNNTSAIPVSLSPFIYNQAGITTSGGHTCLADPSGHIDISITET